MKAQKRRSQNRERFKYYKGQMMWINSPYGYGLSNKVGLFYCPVEGNDIYFKSVGKAKRHIDSCYKPNLTPEMDFSEDDIPF